MGSRWIVFSVAVISTSLPSYVGHTRTRPASDTFLPSRRIIGGERAVQGDLPYVVGIQRKVDAAIVCGGVVYDARHVLSAAHCFDRREPISNFRVLGGTVDILNRRVPSRVEMDIIKEFKHDQYDGSSTYDITILEVGGAFPPGMIVPVDPIKTFDTNDKCVLAGWGTIVPHGVNGSLTKKPHKDAYPSIMRVVTFTMLPSKVCETSYKNVRFGSEVFCAGDIKGGRDGCKGDSGSPLVCGGRLAGIMSAGAGCAQSMHPGVYVNVTHFREWIDCTIQQSYFPGVVSQNSTADTSMTGIHPSNELQKDKRNKLRARSRVRYQMRSGSDTVWRPIKTRHRKTSRRRPSKDGIQERNELP